jgi:hypothetical protein
MHGRGGHPIAWHIDADFHQSVEKCWPYPQAPVAAALSPAALRYQCGNSATRLAHPRERYFSLARGLWAPSGTGVEEGP